MCLRHYEEDEGGCGFFTFRTIDNACFIKRLRKNGRVQKVEERYIKKSPDHVCGDLSRLQGALCCRPCWRNLQKWMWSMMVLGMVFFISLLSAVVHDLDLMHQDQVELPVRDKIRWLKPFMFQDEHDG